MVFAGYYSFFHHLQLTCHNISARVATKRMGNSILMVFMRLCYPDHIVYGYISIVWSIHLTRLDINNRNVRNR